MDHTESPRAASLHLWLPWAVTGGVIIALVIIAILKFAAQPASPLPRSVTKDNNFAVYFPSPAPSGYKYSPGSYKISNHVAIFALQNSNLKIYVAEQALPAMPPDLSKNNDFKSIDGSAGKIHTGTSAGRPVAIIQTNTTLITVSGSEAVPSDAVSSLAQSLRSLPK